MAQGIDPGPFKSSINSTDQTSKRGIEATAPSNNYVFGPGSNSRGVTVAPSSTESNLPR